MSALQLQREATAPARVAGPAHLTVGLLNNMPDAALAAT